MKLLRAIFGVIVLLALLGGAAWIFRLPLASLIVRQAMAQAGLETPSAKVSALTVERIVIDDLTAGPSSAPGFAVERTEISFNWRRVLNERKVNSVKAGPGSVHLVVDDAGSISLPGFVRRSRSSGNSPVSLPLDEIDVSDIAVVVEMPGGAIGGTIAGAFNVDNGGSAIFDLASAENSGAGLRAENAVVKGDAVFAKDGTLKIAAVLGGDIAASQIVLNGAEGVIDATGTDWRDLLGGQRDQLQMKGVTQFRVADIPVDQTPMLAILNSDNGAALSGGEISSLAMRSDVQFTFSAGVLSVSLTEGPTVLTTDTGVRVTLAPVAGMPLFARTIDGDALNADLRISGARTDVETTIAAQRGVEGWQLTAPISVGTYASDVVSIGSAQADLSVTGAGTDIRADFALITDLKNANVGRLRVSDAPLNIRGRAALDLQTQSATISLDDECTDVPRARVELEGQASLLSVTRGRICQRGSPLAAIDWSGDMKSRVNGDFIAAAIRYQLAKTTIIGVPPRVTFSARYQPTIRRTDINGDFKGGSMIVNDLLRMTQSEGGYRFLLDGEAMSVSATADRVILAQNLNLPLVSPVMGTGDLTLKNDRVAFDYQLSAPGGYVLGKGTGEHDVTRAAGKSTIVFDNIFFEPDGLQPDRLAPVLKGVIGTTSGASSGVAEFSWTSAGVTSAAQININDLTFGGPTRIITQTKNLNGELRFDQLWPVKTAGVQTISVGGVDLDALQLGAGEVQFELPGDETLSIPTAEFPWFGGVLGVYSANASMSGGEASAPMKASKIDLGQVFDYANIDGLSGEGVLTGVLPLKVENGRARIENGLLHSEGPGFIRYEGKAAEQAAQTGQQAKTAFDLLRNLQYDELNVTINGPLDGRLDFQIEFEGTGDVEFNGQNARVPVIYRISLDAALLELLRQANLSRDIQMQIQQGVEANRAQ